MQEIKNPTLNKLEVEKFSKTADLWWNKNGPYGLLHTMNPLRIFFIKNAIIDNFKNISNDNINILDIGCGGGITCESLCKEGFKITGVDPSEESILVAKEHAKRSNLNINYYVASPESLSTDNKFDVVISLEVIEHVQNPKDFIEICQSLLKKDGVLILSTINRTIKSFALAIVAAEYVLRWVPKGTHNWNNFLKPSELSKILRLYNLNIDNMEGMRFSLTKNQWFLTDDFNMHYIFSASRIG